MAGRLPRDARGRARRERPGGDGADDIVFPLREFTGERIAFEISEGMVTEISGGARADNLRGFIEGYNDPRAYAVSHIGWGLNHHCIWRPDLPGIGMDGRAHYGNVLFSLGPDTEFGGENDTPCHLDLPMQAVRSGSTTSSSCRTARSCLRTCGHRAH
ncbi:2,5-dihydroxypyridine 5,6-dioxygenase [Geodia barretti]|uniref:2,5-dihydroxypyridine 5,6-dioxygenase n=1 Tax=Geodia barretti TaxID=519541 RepID=A0AA35TS34_GEOBA|nr:2,5-dihydroxypyridine 5,6-dioxygenase [Geodia barretti]